MLSLYSIPDYESINKTDSHMCSIHKLCLYLIYILSLIKFLIYTLYFIFPIVNWSIHSWFKVLKLIKQFL